MRFHRRHLFLGIELRLTALPPRTRKRPPAPSRPGSGKIWKYASSLRQLVKQAHAVVQAHQHRVQAGHSPIRVIPLQPLAALKPTSQLPSQSVFSLDIPPSFIWNTRSTGRPFTIYGNCV